MDAYTFIKLNQQHIESVNGCLTGVADITTYENGKLTFHYFEDGQLVRSKTKE